MIAASESDLVAALVVYLVVVLGIAVACGYGARSIMVGKGRSASAGFCLGFFLGLIGLLIAALLSPTPQHRAIEQRQLMTMMHGGQGYQPYGSNSPAASPGQWAPDPFGRHQVRYYDGQKWTDSISNNGVTGFDPAQAQVPVAVVGSWAPDPYGRHELRYYDGTKWTQSVSNFGVASLDPFG